MKKLKYFLLLCLFAIISTGCVKYNATMTINKDKSMDFTIVYAIDTSVFGSDKELKESDFESLKKEGYTVTAYSEGTMKGFTMSKKISNIDDVSTTDDISFDLSGLMTDAEDNKYIFKVEKGLLKNTYTAVFKFDSNNSGLGTDDIEEEDEEIIPDENLFTDSDFDLDLADEDDNSNDTLTTGSDDTLTIGSDSGEDLTIGSDSGEDDNESEIDYSSLMQNMDLSFKVNLPSGAISNNATTAENGNKNLTWSLTSAGSSNIEFKFAIYNMTIFYIGGAVLLVIILVIVLIIMNKKGKKKEVVINDKQIEIKNDDNENVEVEPALNEKVNVMEKKEKKDA